MYHPSRNIGLVYDTVPSPCSKVVIEFEKKWNSNTDNSCDCFVGFVYPCLTSK